MKNWYLHTINKQPGHFHDGQICYASRRSNVNILVPDLATIRRQQKQSAANRIKWGITDDAPDKYGYITFRRATSVR